MGFPINGDLVPSTSGRSNLGVDVGVNGSNAFDIASIRPFNHIHQISGVFHDPIMGTSGIIRFNQQGGTFEASSDGGITFSSFPAAGSVSVTSVGVIGDTNLTGAVDFATRASGFMIIEDSSDASPLLWAVDNQGLSGFWDFPAQGFNGRVVNALTDFNGTEAQGVINVVGASGIIVDIVGQTMTVASDVDISNLARCYVETFSAATSWVATHSLATEDVVIMVLDDSSPRVEIIPDEVEITDANNVTVGFNVAQGGRIIILGC
jgi:hypothetical protein